MISAQDVIATFVDTFDGAPDGVWSAPGRVNLIGEHTDYTGGFVMPFAIQHRAYVAVRRREDDVVRAVAHGRGVAQTRISDVRLGTPGDWLGYLAGAAWVHGGHFGWDITLRSDVPIGGGLSSSAAITCAALLAMNDVAEWGLSLQSLALLAQRVEHEVIGTPSGIMDQTASLRCVESHLLMLDTQSLHVTQVPWAGVEHGLTLLITDTQTPHQLVDGQYALRRQRCEEATARLGVGQLRDATPELVAQSGPLLTDEQAACARHVTTENERVLQVQKLLEAGEPEKIGPLLTASHASLRDDFRVTVPQLDIAVDTALANGALGARMTGGGFGGCTVTLAPNDEVGRIQRAIEAAFAQAGFAAPRYFITTPAAGARRDL